jgi:hypothetical protein
MPSYPEIGPMGYDEPRPYDENRLYLEGMTH